MCLVRLDNHVESVAEIVAGLENGTRTMTNLEIAKLLKEMDEALHHYYNASVRT